MGFGSLLAGPDDQGTNVRVKRPSLGYEGNNAPVREETPVPTRPNNNADHRPYKALPIDTTGTPVGVGGAGQQKSPFMTVDKVTPVKDVPTTKPPVEGADTTFEINWKMVVAGVGAIALLVLVLFNI
jgi:hypothetical protein